ncbi:MAG: ketoacyl-ACP synthase III [Victivallaceae bacterium]|nr:ketoacyl-ACP synthase III [Victivallaceae bacterium]
MEIRIVGTGSYLPEKRLTNADLERMVQTDDEWIVSRTGIKERRIAAPDQTTSDMGFEACRRAVDAAGIDASELSAIIVATSTPDYVFPSTASLIERRLGAHRAFCFDISSACTGFVAAMELGYSIMLGNADFKHVLVCGAERLSGIVDWTDRGTCVLFGDGAGAVLLSKTDEGNAKCLLASDIHADGEHAEMLCLPSSGCKKPPWKEPADSHEFYIHMAGRETFKRAVVAMAEAARNVVKKDDVDLVIPHQANARIIQAVATRLELPDEKVFMNIAKYGNTSAASIGICLDEAIRSGRVGKGDVVLTASFGSGLTWGALLLRL